MSRARWLTALLASLLVSLSVLTGHAQEIPGGLPAGVAHTAAAEEAEVTPLTIFGSKLVAWYRPDTGHVSVDGSNNVTQLDDRSGNAHHFNVVGGTPLLVDASGVNAIDFESADSDSLSRAAALVSDEPFAIYAVADLESTTGTKSLVTIGDAGATEYWSLRVNSTPALAFLSAHAGIAQAVHGTTLSTATRYVFFGENSANNARRVNVNGGTEVTEATSKAVGTVDRTFLGARSDASLFYDGRIFEVVVLNAAPSAGENTAYLAYTTSRFGTP